MPEETLNPQNPMLNPPSQPAEAGSSSGGQEPVSLPSASAEASAGTAPPASPTHSTVSTGAQGGEQSRTTSSGQAAERGIDALLRSAREKIQFRKRAKLDKIVALARARGKIVNDDVEKSLRVSDKTAERYLNQLIREGRLRRVGKLKKPYYEAI